MARLYDARTIAAVYGVLFAVAAVCLYEIDKEPGSQAFFDWLWPYFFGAAAVLAFLFTAFPHNRWFAAWSGAGMAGACVSRAWGLFAGGFYGDSNLTDARTILGGSFWVGFGFAISVVWFKSVMPASSRQTSHG